MGHWLPQSYIEGTLPSLSLLPPGYSSPSGTRLHTVGSGMQEGVADVSEPSRTSLPIPSVYEGASTDYSVCGSLMSDGGCFVKMVSAVLRSESSLRQSRPTLAGPKWV